SIDGDDIPTKAAIFFFERLDVHHVFHPAVDLQAIAVDDPDQIIELEMARFHCSFPNLTFLLLSVSHDAEDVVIFLIQPGSERHAHGDAQTLAERSGRHLYSWQLEPMGVPLKWRIQLAQQRDILLRTEAGVGKAEVETRRFVSR